MADTILYGWSFEQTAVVRPVELWGWSLEGGVGTLEMWIDPDGVRRVATPLEEIPEGADVEVGLEYLEGTRVGQFAGTVHYLAADLETVGVAGAVELVAAACTLDVPELSAELTMPELTGSVEIPQVSGRIQ
jgi:hypothetical protein